MRFRALCLKTWKPEFGRSRIANAGDVLISTRRILITLCSLLFCTFSITSLLQAQQIDTSMLSEMRWRNVGPFRGGRTRALAGVPGQPNVFYIGAVNGGVWKTNDYGRTWSPIFDHESSASIGAIAIAPSDPNIIYVGSGEGLHRPDLSVGNGIYKSVDAGVTWTHLGLREGQQISVMAVDPRDPNRLFVAVAGHPYGPNPERGIYRSTDGGQSFQKVLYKDENIGGNDVEIDPSDPNTVYATLWDGREGPWENGAWNGTGGGIYKSTDGGQTWNQLARGLPQDIVQAYVTIAPSNPKRLFATVAVKDTVEFYRSEDAGATWSTVTSDTRPKTRIGGGDLCIARFDPKDPDILYVVSIVTWRSMDGGKTWTGIRGAPGGDDYQNVWINPDNPSIIALVSDQGAIISVNGGQTWSSWYNQPTAQLYHVNADNSFPYRLCSGQQESGSVCIASRGNDGAITFRDWHPVDAEEYGYVVPDPLDADTIFGGKLTRYNRHTAQSQNISPMPVGGPDFRVIRTEPIVFDPFDQHLMYFAANTLWLTSDGGSSWKQVSPDLTRKTYDVPASVGVYKSDPAAEAKQRGVIYALAVSPVERGRMWAGTDDGLIWLTTDAGAHWNNVTPPQLSAWQKVSVLEASHTDSQTAYAAVNTLRLDDLRPHIYRTHDSGKTWTEITAGVAADQNVNSVREDSKRKGLLFAGVEGGVYVSFDDGDHWESLRLNLAATSVRDVLIKDDDLAIATHGRGFWILDDITPLRQLSEKVMGDPAYLFTPEPAHRVHWDTNPDTPLPPDEPAGQNPPDGAILNYYLKSASSSPVTLEVVDDSGKVIRRYSSADAVPAPDPDLPVPEYWVRPYEGLSAAAGFHRFLWDMHYKPVAGAKPDYPISAVEHETAPVPTSPWAMPGKYRVVLTVDGKKYIQPLAVQMDPRVRTSNADLQKQFDLSNQLYQDLQALQPIIDEASEARAQLKDRQQKATGPEAAKLEAASKELAAIEGGGRRRRRGPQPENLNGVHDEVQQLFTALQEVDEAPTSQVAAAVPKANQSTQAVIQEWKEFQSKELMPLGVK
jgi:photosystem II stability/assembly factor-like uncharacterized protein